MSGKQFLYCTSAILTCSTALWHGGVAEAGPKPWRADQIQRVSRERAPVLGDPGWLEHAVWYIMAGDPDELPIDSPELRIDPNTTDSPFRGVCSPVISVPSGIFRCSGAPISPTHIITAAHCVDQDRDRLPDPDAAITITFNVSGGASFVVQPESVVRVDVHPDFDGGGGFVTFNDDLAIITFAEPLPTDIPIYPLYRGELRNAEQLHVVGYGQSGYGTVGATLTGSTTIKRLGANLAESFFEDDDGGETLEVWLADFDAPDVPSACFGSESLGNDIETVSAPGDSGGPAFLIVDDGPSLWGTITFGSTCTGGSHTVFSALFGGAVINGFLPWIDSIVECAGNCDDCNDNGVPDGVEILQNPGLDLDENGVLDLCEVTGDVDGDGDVDFSDLLALLAAWGVCTPGQECPADINETGVVDFGDLLILLSNWS